MNARDYFTSYIADDKIRQLNIDLVSQILSFEPASVFEFGAGVGKNLALLLEKKPNLYAHGIDLSAQAVRTARQDKHRSYIHKGDESSLQFLPSSYFDVCFTCSVLDHIPEHENVHDILSDLKRMSRKAVILCETLADRPDVFYFPHNYESEGFTKSLDYSYFSDANTGGDNNVYNMWLITK